MKVLKLVRYQNLLMIALMQYVFRYGFLKDVFPDLALSDFQFLLLVIATVLISAGGYVINDILDQDIDLVNKKEKTIVGNSVSEKNAYTLYFVLNVIGVGAGILLSYLINKPSLGVIFIVIVALLHFYSSNLKSLPLIGNIVVSLLLSFSLIILGLFDLFPIVNDTNKTTLLVLFELLIDFSVFAFFVNLIRELIKDFEDVEGDKAYGMKTLPIAIGERLSKTIVVIFVLISLILLLNYVLGYMYEKELFISVLYIFAFIAAPLSYVGIQVILSKSSKEYHHLSTVLKWVIFFGILSVLVIQWNIKENVKEQENINIELKE